MEILHNINFALGVLIYLQGLLCLARGNNVMAILNAGVATYCIGVTLGW